MARHSCCLTYHTRKGVPGSEWKGVKGWFSWNVRSGFGWFILSLLIELYSQDSFNGLAAAHAHGGWWLRAHGEALPYLFSMRCQLSTVGATAAKGSGRSKGSNSVMGDAWPTALKWSERWRVSLFPEPFGDDTKSFTHGLISPDDIRSFKLRFRHLKPYNSLHGFNAAGRCGFEFTRFDHENDRLYDLLSWNKKSEWIIFSD